MANEVKGSNRVIWLIPFLLLGLSYVLHLPSSPHFVPMGADSGIFAYGAERILNGDLLYQEVWDHKPPGVFYINALAIFIGGASPWSIWWLGVLWVAIVSIAFFYLLRLLTHQIFAALGAIILLATIIYPTFYLDGNFSEVYSLLPQLLIVFAAYAHFRTTRKRWIFILGGLTAITLLFKQTYIATGVASCIVILIFQYNKGGWRCFGSALMSFLSGLLLPILLVIGFWWAKGALANFIDATLLFNLDYAQAGLSINNIYATLRTLFIMQPMSAVVLLCLSGMVWFIVEYALPWMRDSEGAISNIEDCQHAEGRTESVNSIRTIACLYLAVPIEICLLFLSGRNFGHYFLTPLPVFVGGAVLAISQAIPSTSRPARSRKSWNSAWVTLVVLLLVAWGIEVSVKVLPKIEHIKSVEVTLQGDVPLQPIRKYIIENSKPEDSVLIWGVHPALNFITQRRSPTRFLNPISLLYQTSRQESKLASFMTDLENDPPKLILAHEAYVDYLIRPDIVKNELCSACSPGVLEELGEYYELVSSGYSQVERIGDWIIFEQGTTK